MMIRLLFRAAVVFACLGCASSRQSDTPRPTRDMSVLAGAELLGQGGISLYDQIRRVRPNWLNLRGISSIGDTGDGIVVYRDGVRLGGVGLLRDMMVESVESARFLSGPEAASRYGLDHQHGAIVVTTRKR